MREEDKTQRMIAWIQNIRRYRSIKIISGRSKKCWRGREEMPFPTTVETGRING